MKNPELKDVTMEQIRQFWTSLNSELDSYGTNKLSDFLRDGEYIQGVWVDGRLASLGGILNSFCNMIIVPIQLVHRDFQGRGLSYINGRICIDWAKSHKRSLLLSPVNSDNKAIRQSQKKDGYIEFFTYKHQTWAYMALNWRGRLYHHFVPLCIRLYFSPVMWPLRFVRKIFKQRQCSSY